MDQESCIKQNKFLAVAGWVIRFLSLNQSSIQCDSTEKLTHLTQNYEETVSKDFSHVPQLQIFLNFWTWAHNALIASSLLLQATRAL